MPRCTLDGAAANGRETLMFLRDSRSVVFNIVRQNELRPFPPAMLNVRSWLRSRWSRPNGDDVAFWLFQT